MNIRLMHILQFFYSIIACIISIFNFPCGDRTKISPSSVENEEMDSTSTDMQKGINLVIFIIKFKLNKSQLYIEYLNSYEHFTISLI